MDNVKGIPSWSCSRSIRSRFREASIISRRPSTICVSPDCICPFNTGAARWMIKAQTLQRRRTGRVLLGVASVRRPLGR
jgi:hypothetical protein